MQFERKRNIMDNLLLFAQKESLNEKQKKAFLKIVKELPKGTNLQKERFIMYFGLDKTKGKRKKFVKCLKFIIVQHQPSENRLCLLEIC